LGFVVYYVALSKIVGGANKFFAGTPTCIRRRKLSCAAYDIQNTDEKIIDIAMRYGYLSADAFTVYFRRNRSIRKRPTDV